MAVTVAGDDPTEAAVRDALREVLDPELGVNVLDLGLVYGVEVVGGEVRIALTMTSPACPLGELLVDETRAAVLERVPAAQRVEVEIVWDPPWAPEMMSERARRELGWAQE